MAWNIIFSETEYRPYINHHINKSHFETYPWTINYYKSEHYSKKKHQNPTNPWVFNTIIILPLHHRSAPAIRQHLHRQGFQIRHAILRRLSARNQHCDALGLADRGWPGVTGEDLVLQTLLEQWGIVGDRFRIWDGNFTIKSWDFTLKHHRCSI